MLNNSTKISVAVAILRLMPLEIGWVPLDDIQVKLWIILIDHCEFLPIEWHSRPLLASAVVSSGFISRAVGLVLQNLSVCNDLQVGPDLWTQSL